MLDRWQDQAELFVPAQFRDRIFSAAARAAASGQTEQGFWLVDRACRTAPNPHAHHLLLRTLLLSRLGREARAAADLRSALRSDSADALVYRAALLRADEISKRHAAGRVLEDDAAPDADLIAAVETLQSISPRMVLKAARLSDQVTGWIYAPPAALPRLTGVTEASVFTIPIGRTADLPGLPGRVFRFAVSHDPAEPIRLEAEAEALATQHTTVLAQRMSGAPFDSAPRARRQDGVLNVIVPVYGDAPMTARCLAALERQDAQCAVNILIVDDCSPDPEVSGAAATWAARLGAGLIADRVNHGFAGAVNRALRRCPAGDVLLLNADVILPPGALDRLWSLARRHPGVGTLAPLSNEGEATSFPRPYRPSSLATADEAHAIALAAREANDREVVDVVTNAGFCLYVTEACFSTVGLLSMSYGRGYYEDVDLCCRARQAGFRNVAATGLYVRHASGRSFGSLRLPLVARNLRVLENRVPDYRSACAAFVRADPLRISRGRIEARLSWPTRGILVVAGRGTAHPAARARTERHLARGRPVFMLQEGFGRRAGEVEVLGAAGPPYSIAWPRDAGGLDRLLSFLAGLDLARIEIAGAEALSPTLRRRLDEATPRPCFVIDSLATLDDLLPPGGIQQPPRLAAADAMARSAARARRAGPARQTRPAPAHRPAGRLSKPAFVIGVPVPEASAAVDDLLLGLARAFALRRHGMLLVLGRCLADARLVATGRVHVTGPVAEDDLLEVAADYGADALLSPYRSSNFAVLERLSTKSALPRAYFDWSEASFQGRPDDLVLPYDTPSALVHEAVLRWCGAAV